MRASASKAGLLQHCQYWARSDAEWYSPPSDAAEQGTLTHSIIEHDLELESPHTSAAKWLKGIQGDGQLLVEQALGLEPDEVTAAALEVDGRNYPEGLLCGRADAIIIFGNMVYVVDWKSGQVRDYHHDQLKLLASMAANAFNKKEAWYAIAYVDNDGHLRFAPITQQVQDPTAVLSDYSSLAKQIEGSGTWPGLHCVEQYCPHAAICSEGDNVTKKAKEGDLTITDVNAADMYVLVNLLKKRVKKAEDELKSISRANGGIVVDGKSWRPKKRTTKRLNQKLAVQLAMETGATKEELYEESEYEIFST